MRWDTMGRVNGTLGEMSALVVGRVEQTTSIAGAAGVYNRRRHDVVRGGAWMGGAEDDMAVPVRGHRRRPCSGCRSTYMYSVPYRYSVLLTQNLEMEGGGGQVAASAGVGRLCASHVIGWRSGPSRQCGGGRQHGDGHDGLLGQAAARAKKPH